MSVTEPARQGALTAPASLGTQDRLVAPIEQVVDGMVPKALLDALDALGLTVIATGTVPVGRHVILPYEVVRNLVAEANAPLQKRYLTREDQIVVQDAIHPYAAAEHKARMDRRLAEATDLDAE